MKLFKTLLAWVMAMAALIAGSAHAGSASTTMNINGSVVGTCSISAANLDVGPRTKIELESMVFNHNIIVNCTDGASYTVFADNPGSSAWTLNGGTAKNAAGGVGTVWLLIYRTDGTTAMTPSSGWARTGTGFDEPIQLVMKLLPQGNYFGTISATIQPTVQWN